MRHNKNELNYFFYPYFFVPLQRDFLQTAYVMEQYIVSARKYRPQTFKSVIGQNALTQTLKNAIANEHLAHAYLFCGPRGVGKTTCARIFAKTINCMTPTAEGEACNQCESCRSFNEQRSFNIHELDAASNNSVEDIRSLVDQVRIPPQIGRYSVYIVDEVHMLSTAAFNAFLKTLEEPPAHAIFILATTEKHKIIPTILSRCQIYDFNRIRISDTVEHLKYVASSEGITAEDTALGVIAQKADGAMRDALSIFDQIVSFCGPHITYKDVIENLNVLDYDYYFRIVDALIAGKVPDALMIFDSVLAKGFEGQHFVGGLASHLRNIMVSKDTETISLLEVSDAIADKYKIQAESCNLGWIYKALEIANDCDLSYRTSRNKRLLVEVMLIRIAGLATEPSSPKKAELELPLIAVAPTPVISDEKKQATAPTVEMNTARKTAHIGGVTKTSTTIPITHIRKQAVMLNKIQPQIETPINHQQEEKKDIEIQTKQTYPVQTKEFSDTELLTAWRLYARTIEKEAHTTNTMLNFLPEKGIGSEVCVKVVNSMQVEALQNHKKRIELFLAEQLHNNNIVMKIIIDNSVTKHEAFTPDEKLRRMRNNNPEFERLYNTLGLELV